MILLYAQKALNKIPQYFGIINTQINITRRVPIRQECKSSALFYIFLNQFTLVDEKWMQGIKLLKMEAKQSLMVNNMIVYPETHRGQLKNKKIECSKLVGFNIKIPLTFLYTNQKKIRNCSGIKQLLYNIIYKKNEDFLNLV